MLKGVQAGCERHYDGTIHAGFTGAQFTGTVQIDCPGAAGVALRGPL